MNLHFRYVLSSLRHVLSEFVACLLLRVEKLFVGMEGLQLLLRNAKLWEDLLPGAAVPSCVRGHSVSTIPATASCLTPSFTLASGLPLLSFEFAALPRPVGLTKRGLERE